MTDISRSVYYEAISVDGVASQQRQTEFQIQPELNKEGKASSANCNPPHGSHLEMEGHRDRREQEGRKGTKGHRQEVVKDAAQVWKINEWPLPSKS